ncbi:formylglycine-generating enzyme family protein [Anatilimnocola sp. NA78]|uniref:formylglycine-generating enzyme family protein n=1 Tax=Anatilimnocola sp. NA78 TaxID=3415683 RepID=UPI003CE58DA1
MNLELNTNLLKGWPTWAAGASVPACLAFAWQSEQWAAGASGAMAGLGYLAWDKYGRRFTSPHSPGINADTSFTSLMAATERDAEPEGDLVQRMLTQGRYSLLLRPQIANNLQPDQLHAAEAALDTHMSCVPGGPVIMRPRRFEDMDEEELVRNERIVEVDGYFLDRYPVTNEAYLRFVQDGGYEQMNLWDATIWPAVLGFVDSTGLSGPRYWKHGHPTEEKRQHPVVGICWYEAAAYARWAGKRLSTDPEWVKAGAWPVVADNASPQQRRYPWGDALDRSLVHVWGSGKDDTTCTTGRPLGASVGGVQELVGNVWEWTSTSFGVWDLANLKIETATPMRSIRGGAFDTYFDSQCHLHFQSGESPLARKHNIGFRCAVGFCDVASYQDSATEEQEAAA